MSPDFKKLIIVDLEMLSRIKADFEPLCIKCKDKSPDLVELTALAGMLHSFYGGVENIFKRIAKDIDNNIPEGSFWHYDLLEQMTKPSSKRVAFISESMKSTLHLYMNFRHVFRHAYVIELRWKKMEQLIVDFPANFGKFEQEVNLFISTL